MALVMKKPSVYVDRICVALVMEKSPLDGIHVALVMKKSPCVNLDEVVTD